MSSHHKLGDISRSHFTPIIVPRPSYCLRVTSEIKCDEVKPSNSPVCELRWMGIQNYNRKFGRKLTMVDDLAQIYRMEKKHSRKSGVDGRRRGSGRGRYHIVKDHCPCRSFQRDAGHP